MTIQVAVMNGSAIALASDRHIYRDGRGRSTGRDAKIQVLPAAFPMASMHAGWGSLFGIAASRIERVIGRRMAECSNQGAAAMIEAASSAAESAIIGCGGGWDASEAREADTEVMATMASCLVARAPACASAAEAAAFLEGLLPEITASAAAPGHERIAADGWVLSASASEAVAALLEGRARAVFDAAPDTVWRASIEALSRTWRVNGEMEIIVALHASGDDVPAYVALALWRSLGMRLSCRVRATRVLRRSADTGILGQGSGGDDALALVSGIHDDHQDALMDEGPRSSSERAADARWARMHERLAVSSAAELGSIAAGLVRGAEVSRYLTGDREGTVGEVDGVILSAGGAKPFTLAAGLGLAA